MRPPVLPKRSSKRCGMIMLPRFIGSPRTFNRSNPRRSFSFMHYRELGQTGLKVSKLGYGAAALGGVYRSLDEATGIRAVHTALDLGINLIDVAPYYGATKAE